MVTKPKIDYAAVLADLEARRADIDAAIRAIKALLPGEPAAKGRPRGPRKPQPGDLDYEGHSQNTSGGANGDR